MRLNNSDIESTCGNRETSNPYPFTMSDNHHENATPMCSLDLPSELRDMIYERALVDTKAIDLTSWNDDHELRVRSSYRKSGLNKARTASPRASLGTNLLRTCRQVYNEGIEILYGKNSFELYAMAKSLACSVPMSLRILLLDISTD